MKGVAKVSGPNVPKIGETNYYEVTAFHKGTVITDPKEIKWILYEKKDGKYYKLDGEIKRGKKVTFSFPQKWYNKELLIEAYLFDPVASSPPGLIVRPTMGQKKIVSAEILNESGGALTENPKYGQFITLKVKTDNMLGDTLILSLMDDDTHDVPGNTSAIAQILWSGSAKINDSSGVIEHKIMLSPSMRQLANNSTAEGDTHEYYLLVQGNEAVIGSKITQVSNEIMLSPDPPPQPKPAPAPAPVLPSAQLQVIVKNAIGIALPKPVEATNVAVVEGTSVINCNEKHCIKKGDKSELIREINIRLAGFGGNVPTDEFTDRTEKMIKQFQKDYMNIAPTGKICGNLLKSIDEFQAKLTINFKEILCRCTGGCTGFGNGRGEGQYSKAEKAEKYHKKEYPGIHRSLLHCVKASNFYLKNDDIGYVLGSINSGYRCHNHPEYIAKGRTNHCGKAIDLGYHYKSGGYAENVSDFDNVRNKIFVKRSGAGIDWDNGPDIFYLESADVGATSWVHVDVREFSQIYLKNEYFVKDVAGLNGRSIVALAMEQGFQKTCICNGTGKNPVSAEVATTPSTAGRVDPNTLKTSPIGIEFIKAYEKFESLPYNDAEGFCTIGYGHLIKYSKCDGSESPEFLKGITKARAMELFNQRLVTFENGLRRSIKVNLYQHEFDALVSLLFNAGESFLDNGGANGGNTRIKIKINKGNYSAGIDEIIDVDNGGLVGLVKRRKAEINMFKNKVYEMHD